MIIPVPVDSDTLSEGLRLGKPLVETACRTFESVVGRPLAVVGDLLGDEVYAFQCSNRIRIMAKFAALLRGKTVPRGCMPPGFLVSVLEAGSNVEDGELQDIWARLLAGAVSNSANQHPMFIDVLRKWSSAEATLFDRVCAECGLADESREIAEKWPDSNPSLHELVMDGWGVFQPRPDEAELTPTIAMLEATGILKFRGTLSSGEGTVPSLSVTIFARRLFNALRPS